MFGVKRVCFVRLVGQGRGGVEEGGVPRSPPSRSGTRGKGESVCGFRSPRASHRWRARVWHACLVLAAAHLLRPLSLTPRAHNCCCTTSPPAPAPPRPQNPIPIVDGVFMPAHPLTLLKKGEPGAGGRVGGCECMRKRGRAGGRARVVGGQAAPSRAGSPRCVCALCGLSVLRATRQVWRCVHCGSRQCTRWVTGHDPPRTSP